MGHRVSVMLSGLALLFASQLASALGLGDITLKSSLNQPLVAEIKLLEVGDLSEAEILVGLASQEDFKRIGVDRPFFLTNLRYNVTLGTPRGDLIVVTSNKAVREPFLNFVVQVRWPSGKLLREYTLLMDLPVFSGESSAPVAAAQGSTSSNTSRNSQASNNSNQGQSSEYVPRSSFGEQQQRGSQQGQAAGGSSSSSAASGGSDVYGPVKANDTLWEIARDARPDSSVTVQQTMLAIQGLNPDAFINSNINLLKKGQVLRLPDSNQVRELSRNQATAQVAAQNRAWGGAAAPEATDGAQLDARNNTTAQVAQSSEPEGRIKLSSPDDAFDASEGRGSGAGASSTEALENELSSTLEQLDKSNKDNTELRSKVESLEEQITTMERMMEVSNEELRSLELSIQKTKEETEALEAAKVEEQSAAEQQASLASSSEEMASEPDAASPDAESATEESAEELASETEEAAENLNEELASGLAAAEAQQQSAAEEVVEATPTSAPTRAPAKVISQPKPEKGIMDLVMENILYVGAGALALLLGIFLAVRKMMSKDEEDDYQDELFSQPVAQEPVLDETQKMPEDLDDLENLGEELSDEPIEAEEEAATEAETGDPVAEADIYIAYGKYDKAAEMLTKSLATDGENTDVHLKLLEVYAGQQNLDAFDEHLPKLLALDSSSATERANELRESIDGVSGLDIESVDDLDSLAGLDDDSTVLKDLPEDSTLDLSLDSNDLGTGDLDLDLDLDAVSQDDADDKKAVDNDDTVLKDDFDGDLDLELEKFEQVESDDVDLDLETASLELDGDLDGELAAVAKESASDDSLDLDFDLEVDDGSGEVSEEINLDDIDLDLDTEFAAKDAPSDDDTVLQKDLAKDLEEPAQIKDDLDSDLAALDLDLEDLDADLSSLDSDLNGKEVVSDTGAMDVSSDDLDFDLGELDSELAAASDSELDALLDVGLDDELSVDTKDTKAEAKADDALDELDMSDDLDLSSLDDELSALTSDLDVDDKDFASLDLEESAKTTAKDASDELADLPDFDDFDLEEGLESLDAQLEPEDKTVDAKKTNGADPEDLSSAGEDTMFNKALSGVPDANLDFEIPDVDPESMDDDEDLEFLNESDETATKLDLARAYIDMGDAEGAKDILAEIRAEGSEAQRLEADRLSERLS